MEPIIGFSFDLFSMEVSVTIASRACEGFNGAFFSTRHELTATVCGIASHGSCMVFETLFVLDMLLVVVVIVMMMKIHFHLVVATINGSGNDMVTGGRRVMVVDDMVVVVVVAGVTTI